MNATNRNLSINDASAFLNHRLGSSWAVKAKGHGGRATVGLLSVSLKHHPDDPRGAWRCRLRDSFPRHTIMERYADSMEEAASDVVDRAINAQALINGKFQLAHSPANTWLAYRLWSAVRPI